MEPQQLGDLPLFEGLTDEELGARSAARFDEIEVLAGTGLAKQDDFAYKFFVVLDGEVDIRREFKPVARLGTGEFFGETALVTGERRNARVTAHTHCRLACTMLWEFREMVDELPLVAERIDREVAARSASTIERAAD